MASLSTRKRTIAPTIFIITLLLAAGVGITAFVLFFEGEPPVVAIEAPRSFLGTNSTISIAAADNRSGLRRLHLTISQGDQQRELLAESFPRTGHTGLVGVAERQVSLDFSSKQHGLSDGPAVLTLSASDYSWRGFFQGNKATVSRDVLIDTVAPKISLIYSDRYVNQGGSGMVIYRMNEPEAQSGVQLNDLFHPCFPIGDGRDDTYLALFAVPYDAAAITTAQVVAVDQAGNRTTTSFSPNFKATAFKQDRITIDDRFLEAKIPEFRNYYPDMEGSLIEQYLHINTVVRDSNNAKIAELCTAPHPERLWQGNLSRMPGSPRAGFADHRTYFYNDSAIDRQVHLGIDIASTRNADVRAAATGNVIFADYLGIYGNMVILDHGQGLFSLYSHLSQMNVNVGDRIERETTLGLTGTSGMAGGDHLHFSVLINGVFVTPVEWWDQHWIDVNIEEPIQQSKFQ